MHRLSATVTMVGRGGRCHGGSNVWRRRSVVAHCWLVLMVACLITSWMNVGANAQDAGAGADAGAVPNEGNPCSIGWYKAHGWLMWLAFGVFFPLGVFVSRFGQLFFSQWFWTHICLQVTGVILSTIAFAISASQFQVSPWDNTHVKLGLAIMILVWLQPLFSIIRPRRGGVIRPMWYFVHWLFGTAAIVLAWFNMFKGLDEYVGSWPSGGERKASYVLLGINVAILGFLYLLLDRLPYIRAQAKGDGEGTASAADNAPFHKAGGPGHASV